MRDFRGGGGCVRSRGEGGKAAFSVLSSERRYLWWRSLMDLSLCFVFAFAK